MIDDLIAGATGRYIDDIVTATTAARGLPRRGSVDAGFIRRVLTLVLLVAVALAPAVSRAHLRVSVKPNPAQENARFRWTDSCERVPSRAVADHHIPAVILPFTLSAGQPVRRVMSPEDVRPRVLTLDLTPPGLRAPPVVAL